MEIKEIYNKPESFRPGLPRRIILDSLRKEEKQWKCHQIPPTKETPIRCFIFSKKEEWRFEDEE